VPDFWLFERHQLCAGTVRGGKGDIVESSLSYIRATENGQTCFEGFMANVYGPDTRALLRVVYYNLLVVALDEC
jgi:hypothetical protein